MDPPETSLRGRTILKRRVVDVSSNVRVLVRCRPLVTTEGGHTASRLRINGNKVIVSDGTVAGGDREFAFDLVYPPEATQDDVFNEVVALADHTLDGFHATVFAYGQTGSGKTHTMEGLRYIRSKRSSGASALVPDVSTPVENHGVTLRMIQVLFDKARERAISSVHEAQDLPGTAGDSCGREDGVHYRMSCSYYQLYNERITDLLNPKSSALSHGSSHNEGLRLRWHTGDTFRVENLFVCNCNDAESMRDAFFSGTKVKVMRSHQMNWQSSRSHCVFTIYVECRGNKRNEVISRAEFSFVDLAGSEKLGLLSKAPSSKLMRESIDINVSLLALGKVITALGSNAVGRGGASPSLGHVPYRDSKLTKLLKHALGGNSLTTMIACISPSDCYTDETISSLLFAGRARNIRNVPRINEDPKASIIAQLRQEIAQLKQELEYCRALASASVTAVEKNAMRSASTSVTQDPRPHNFSESPAQMPASSDSVALMQADDLADKLLIACDMMKRVMTVNGQLREAYDVIRAVNETMVRRESELNAENLTLRERIEILESIVLQDNFLDAADDSQAIKSHHVNLSGDLDPIVGYDATGDTYVPYHSNKDRNPPEGQHAKLQSPLNEDLPASPSGRSTTQTSCDESTTTTTSVDAPVAILGEPRLRTVLPHAVEDSTVPMPVLLAHCTRRSTKAERRGNQLDARQRMPTGAGARCVSKSRKKQKKLTGWLNDYKRRYRVAPYVETYGQYYRKPRESMRIGAASISATTDMQRKLEHVAPSIVTCMPVSLIAKGMFGKLTYGGTKDDTEEFEARREAREQRLQDLLQRQKQLHEAIENDIRNAKMETSLDGKECFPDASRDDNEQAESLPHVVEETIGIEGQGPAVSPVSSFQFVPSTATGVPVQARKRRPSPPGETNVSQAVSKNYGTLHGKTQLIPSAPQKGEPSRHKQDSVSRLLEYLARQ